MRGTPSRAGLEIAVWCDLRVAAEDAVFGVFCRRWGIPLMDGGTVRLARMIGHSHALDMILTGRGVSGEEALRMGLANRIVPKGRALEEAIALAREIAAWPQAAMRSDRARPTSSGRWGSTRRWRASTATGWPRSGPAELFEGLGRYEAGRSRP